jgi:transposase
MRDLVRARLSAVEDLRRSRQRLQGFLLRHERIYGGRTPWSRAHRRWLAGLAFDHPAEQIVFQEHLHAIDDTEARRDRLTEQITELLSSWSMAPLVVALQAMRGVALLAAVTLVAEVGDFRRFANPRQLMAYLGLVPSEHSSGKKVTRGRITKAGNTYARRVLVEGAWTYRMQARVSPLLQARLQDLPREVCAIAWKAQVRLCARYRRLAAKGKPKTVVTTAIAREMAAFVWAIAQQVEPTPVA